MGRLLVAGQGRLTSIAKLLCVPKVMLPKSQRTYDTELPDGSAMIVFYDLLVHCRILSAYLPVAYIVHNVVAI